MTEKTNSQSQKKTADNSLLGSFEGFEMLRRFADDNLTPPQTMMEEFGKLEESGRAQAVKAVESAARMMHDSLEAGVRFSRQWREATLDATRKTFDKVARDS